MTSSQDPEHNLAGRVRYQFAMIPHKVIECGLSPHALALYVILKKFEGKDRDPWPSRATLASLMGMKKAASVDRYVDELVKAKLVVVRHRWVDSNGNISTVRTDRHRRQTSSEYALAVQPYRSEMVPGGGPGWSSSQDGGSPSQGTGVVPHRGHELEPPIYNQGRSEVAAAREANGSDLSSVEPRSARPLSKTLMTSEWTPSEESMAWAASARPTADLELATEKFRLHYLGNGVPMNDWDPIWKKWILQERDDTNRYPRKKTTSERACDYLGIPNPSPPLQPSTPDTEIAFPGFELFALN